MSIRSELMAIKGDNELLQVDSVIAATREDPASYPGLHHKLFDRSDAELAEDQRRWIVRQLIAIHIVEDEGHRGFVSLLIDRTGGGGYRAIEDVLPIKRLRDMMLAEALADLDRLQKKYDKLKELAEVWTARDRVRRRRSPRPAPAEPPQPTA